MSPAQRTAAVTLFALLKVVVVLRSEELGVLPPRLLQDHSLCGEPHCTALVQIPVSSGEDLVNGSEFFA